MLRSISTLCSIGLLARGLNRLEGAACDIGRSFAGLKPEASLTVREICRVVSTNALKALVSNYVRIPRALAGRQLALK